MLWCATSELLTSQPRNRSNAVHKGAGMTQVAGPQFIPLVEMLSWIIYILSLSLLFLNTLNWKVICHKLKWLWAVNTPFFKSVSEVMPPLSCRGEPAVDGYWALNGISATSDLLWVGKMCLVELLCSEIVLSKTWCTLSIILATNFITDNHRSL